MTEQNPRATAPGAQIDTQIADLNTKVADLTTRVTKLEQGATTPPVDPPIDPPPTQTGDIPLSWSDPRFNQTVTNGRSTMGKGQTITNRSWQESSGEPTVTCNGDNTMDTCRIKSREAVRIGGSGGFTYRNCYFEAQGSGADHADTIQAYSPGSRGTLTMRNTHIRAYNQAATAGVFIADNWTGTIDIQDCIFQGGPYGLRVHPDTGGDNIIKMRNVFFVGPFGYGAMLFSDVQGHRNIFELWENVCNATIVNGKLVPGTAIPKPA